MKEKNTVNLVSIPTQIVFINVDTSYRIYKEVVEKKKKKEF